MRFVLKEVNVNHSTWQTAHQTTTPGAVGFSVETNLGIEAAAASTLRRLHLHHPENLKYVSTTSSMVKMPEPVVKDA